MARRGRPLSAPSLAERVEGLTRAVSLAADHLDPERLAAAQAVLAKSSERIGHGTDHTVIALAGSTGVGKSSLFNALTGVDISTVGVRRPTTGVAHAAVFGEGADPLLDWLDVGRRHHMEAERVGWEGLVLLDLPDFDSTEAANRSEVDRLVAVVDAMIWVTDPQKYADEAFHDGYIRPLAGHAEVLSFVVNKIDTVPVAERNALVADLARRLVDDGVVDPTIATSAAAGPEGVTGAVELVERTIERRRVVVDRLVADIRMAASSLSSGGSTDGVTKAARKELAVRLGHAAGADSASDIVVLQHVKDARSALGWPPVKIAQRLRRRHPISELPRASASDVARSEIGLALRDVAESAADGLDAPWPTVLRRAASERSNDITSRLTSVTDSSARGATQRPGWWTPVQALQRAVTAVAAVGAIWLLVVAALGGFLQLDTDPLLIDTPGWDWIPLPSLMVLGGLGVGLLIALLVRIPVAVGARRRGHAARGEIRRRAVGVADETVLADIAAILADRAAISDALAVATAP